jgi:hypothetical protein
MDMPVIRVIVHGRNELVPAKIDYPEQLTGISFDHLVRCWFISVVRDDPVTDRIPAPA